jgi:hypothetical protein
MASVTNETTPWAEPTSVAGAAASSGSPEPALSLGSKLGLFLLLGFFLILGVAVVGDFLGHVFGR